MVEVTGTLPISLMAGTRGSEEAVVVSFGCSHRP